MCSSLLPAALLALVAAGSAAAQETAAPPLRFAPLANLDRAQDSSALALDAARGRLAVGDARGVWLREADGRVRRALGSGPVHDLAFAAEGALYVATERGLYEIGLDGRVLRRPLGPGAAGRALRVLPTRVGVFVATGDGILAANSDGPFRPLDGALPGGEVTALAWAPGDAGAGRLWAIVAGELHVASLAVDAGGLRNLGSSREPLASQGGLPIELSTLLPDAEVLVLRRSSLSLRTSSGFETRDLVLPPGVEATRLAFGAGRVWLASDGGLLEAAGPGGPWRRAEGTPGSAAASAVVGSGERIYVATSRGVFASEPIAANGPGVVLPVGHSPAELRFEPEVGAVQRAALRYLELGSDRLRRLERNVARRGLLPELTVHGDYGGFRASDEDHDDTVFSAGNRYQLLDRLNEHGRDFEVGAALRWDLGDTVYHPEEIDVSKEVRELIELRDEVLDEINQLYFERRRVLLERAQLPDAASAEAERLALRVRELAAGLDAWTGGWWSRQAEAPSPRTEQAQEDRP
jgi:ligand-binding sensor domain-containing protein